VQPYQLLTTKYTVYRVRVHVNAGPVPPAQPSRHATAPLPCPAGEPSQVPPLADDGCDDGTTIGKDPGVCRWLIITRRGPAWVGVPEGAGQAPHAGETERPQVAWCPQLPTYVLVRWLMMRVKGQGHYRFWGR